MCSSTMAYSELTTWLTTLSTESVSVSGNGCLDRKSRESAHLYLVGKQVRNRHLAFPSPTFRFLVEA